MHADEVMDFAENLDDVVALMGSVNAGGDMEFAQQIDDVTVEVSTFGEE